VLRLVLCLLLAVPLAGCVAAHRTRTVGRGNLGAELSVGGPLTTSLGPPVPMPMAFLGARYGLRDDLDVSAAYNLTAPIVAGLSLDLQTAVHWAPIQPGLRGQPADGGWSVVGGASLDWVSDFQTGFRVFPALTATGAWRWRFVAPYLGATLGFDFYRPFERRNPLWLTPHLGAECFLGERVALTVELQVMELASNLWGSGVQWVYLGKSEDEELLLGVLAPMIGVSYDLPTRRSQP
jgi:hypothetical protein